MINFKQLILSSLTKKYFQLQGRSSRKEFVYFVLLCWLIGIFNEILKVVLHINWIFFVDIFDRIFFIYTFIPLITLTTRRLHDFNVSGIFIILATIFWLSLLFLGYYYTFLISTLLSKLLLMFKTGINGINKYGEPPSY